MAWWRRATLHERLAREGGLVPGEPPPHDVHPRWGETGIHGLARPREWDAVAVVEAPGLQAAEVRFIALPDGTLLVEDECDEAALAPLAEALEGSLHPPYRAEGVRRSESQWAVAARAIEVSELPEDVPGEEIELSVRGDERALVVDGLPSFGSVPALERLAAGRFHDYAVRAERLDGNFWEVRIAPL